MGGGQKLPMAWIFRNSSISLEFVALAPFVIVPYVNSQQGSALISHSKLQAFILPILPNAQHGHFKLSAVFFLVICFGSLGFLSPCPRGVLRRHDARRTGRGCSLAQSEDDRQVQK